MSFLHSLRGGTPKKIGAFLYRLQILKKKYITKLVTDIIPLESVPPLYLFTIVSKTNMAAIRTSEVKEPLIIVF